MNARKALVSTALIAVMGAAIFACLLLLGALLAALIVGGIFGGVGYAASIKALYGWLSREDERELELPRDVFEGEPVKNEDIPSVDDIVAELRGEA